MVDIILILAENRDKAFQSYLKLGGRASSPFPYFKAAYPGMKTYPKDFVYLVVQLSNEDAINEVIMQIANSVYSQSKVKAIITTKGKTQIQSSQQLDQSAVENEAQVFEPTETNEMKQYLLDTFKAEVQLIRAAANAVDHDNAKNGYIGYEEFRKVLNKLGVVYDLKQTYDRRKSLLKDKIDRIRIGDFVNWYVSGRRDLNDLQRYLIMVRWRAQGFFNAGMNTFTKDFHRILNLGKPLEYHNSKVSLNLNKVVNPGFCMDLRFYGMSPEIEETKSRLAQLHPALDFSAKDRQIFLNVSFKPEGISPSDFAKLLDPLVQISKGTELEISVVTSSTDVSLCLRTFSKFICEVEECKCFQDLFGGVVKAKQSLAMSLQTEASAQDLFAGDVPFLESVAKGVKVELSLSLWKDFFQSQFDMFADTTFIPILVPILFGTCPIFILSLNGELNYTLDERSIELMKQKAATQKVMFYPSALLPSDEDFLQKVLYMTEECEDAEEIYTKMQDDSFLVENGVNSALVLLHKYLGENAEFDFLMEPFAISGSMKSEGGIRDAFKAMMMKFVKNELIQH